MIISEYDENQKSSRKPRTGEFSKEWRIINNVPREQLLSEIEIR